VGGPERDVIKAERQGRASKRVHYTCGISAESGAWRQTAGERASLAAAALKTVALKTVTLSTAARVAAA